MPHEITPRMYVWVSAWAWLLGRHYYAYVHQPTLTCHRSLQRSFCPHSSCKPVLQRHKLLHPEDGRTYSLRWLCLVNDVWMVLNLMTPCFYFLLLQNQSLQSELWQLRLQLQRRLSAVDCLMSLQSVSVLHLEVRFRFASFRSAVDIHFPSFQFSGDALQRSLRHHMVLTCCLKRKHCSYWGHSWLALSAMAASYFTCPGMALSTELSRHCQVRLCSSSASNSPVACLRGTLTNPTARSCSSCFWP